MRSDEKLLTGDTAAKVTAAAKTKEPTATIERVETDSDGVYEAHMVRTDGTTHHGAGRRVLGRDGRPGGRTGRIGWSRRVPAAAAVTTTATAPRASRVGPRRRRAALPPARHDLKTPPDAD